MPMGSRRPAHRTPARTRIAVAGWRAPHAGLAHALVDLDVTAAEAWCREAGAGLTHLVGAAVGRGLAAVPDLNARVVLGRARRRPGIAVSFAVATADGGHLSAVLVPGIDRLHPAEVASRLHDTARALRRGDDPDFGRALRVAETLPPLLLRPGLGLVGFLTAGLGLALRPLRLRASPFGSVLVSAVGSFGIDRVIAPLLPFARVGAVVTVGRVDWAPRVVAGEVVPRRVVTLGVTVDHRLVDGAQAAAFARVLREAVENPAGTWPPAREGG